MNDSTGPKRDHVTMGNIHDACVAQERFAVASHEFFSIMLPCLSEKEMFMQ